MALDLEAKKCALPIVLHIILIIIRVCKYLSLFSQYGVFYTWLVALTSHACYTGFLCLDFSFCVLLFGLTEFCVLQRMGHGCMSCLSESCRWSQMIPAFTVKPGSYQQSLLHTSLSQCLRKPELWSWLVLKTRLKTLNLIHKSGEIQFSIFKIEGLPRVPKSILQAAQFHSNPCTQGVL